MRIGIPAVRLDEIRDMTCDLAYQLCRRMRYSICQLSILLGSSSMVDLLLQCTRDLGILQASGRGVRSDEVCEVMP